MSTQPPPAGFDRLMHPMHRLQICAALAAAERVEFSTIQQHVGLSASALSKQVAALVDAGYVTQRRAPTDSRRMWLTLTASGRAAYRAHVAALHAVIGQDAIA